MFAEQGHKLKAGSNYQRRRELSDDLQAGIARAPFQGARIAPVHAHVMGQFLLGQALGVAEPAKTGGKDMAQTHKVFGGGLFAWPVGRFTPTAWRQADPTGNDSKGAGFWTAWLE